VKRHSGKRLDIQGLRALAVLLVVAYHAGLPLHGGFIGVDVFFAISGFVITRMLVAELDETGGLRLPRFYARRVRRLLPALAVLLVAVALVGTLASPIASQRVGGLTGVWASIFAANAYLYNLGTGYFDVNASLDPLLHTWTLAVEEQFYLVFPALLLLGWRLRGRAGATLLVALASGCSFYLALRFSQAYGLAGIAHPQRFAFYGSPTRAWEFGAGSLLALAAPLLGRLPWLLADGLGAAGLAWIGVGVLVIDGSELASGSEMLLPVLGTCALIAAGFSSRSLVARGLSNRPLVWIGDLSYSWYLWHWPLIVFARALWPATSGVALAAAAASLLPAWLSYRYVETPIRRERRWEGRRALALAGVCVAAPLLASGGLALTPNALAQSAPIAQWRQLDRQHADVLGGCNEETPLGRRRAGECSWRVAGARGEAVLIGDSNAGHFTEPFVQAVRRLHMNATVATLGSCPFVDLRVVGGHIREQDCRSFDTGSVAELARRRPRLVVIAARTDRYVEGSAVGLGQPGSGLSYSPVQKAELWREGLGSFLRRLTRAGVPVVVVHPVPTFAIDPEGCAVVRVLVGRCRATRPRAAVDSQLRRSVEAENAAVAGIPNASAASFESAFCDRQTCWSTRAGTGLYRDATHLSVAGALLLTDRFTRLIAANARGD
jgi:peptidoglycan/LPS O-acetylase OafA/YrhL